MTGVEATYALLRAFVDELARCGMRAACTSPGSRSAPLVLSLASDERLSCYSHIDERCSSFFALGLAKATGLPVAVTCTSGTAAAELLPAAVEAREARVPLLLLTADRPAELRDNGAGQAVDQIKMLGSAAKWFFEVSVHDAGPAELRWIRTLACRAYQTALDGRPGAVHLNFPLREPLVADLQLPPDATGRPSGRPYVTASPLSPGQDSGELAEAVGRARRGVLVTGRHERATPLAAAAAAFAGARGWPLLADPLSGARLPGAAVAHYDALLRDERFAAEHRPDLVLRAGDLPVSKPLRTWLAGLGEVPQVALDPEGAWQDPASVLSARVAAEPASALERLTGAAGAAEEGWLESWLSADERAGRALADVLGSGLSEPAVAAALATLLPADATLFVASSMPVRDIETIWPALARPPRVLCNRGANGIDGTVSSAFGAAASGHGPVVLLIGDVALAHDLGGLIAARRLGLQLTVVLLDNGGGGIFDFLPISRAAIARREAGGEDLYTRHVLTPTGLDFADAARLYGLSHVRVGDLSSFSAAVTEAIGSPGSSIVQVVCSREANVDLHARMWRSVSDALSR